MSRVTAKTVRSSYGLEVDRDEWRDYAACSLKTAEWFEVLSNHHCGFRLSVANHAALELCRTCPVKQPCLDYESAQPDTRARIAGGQILGRNRVDPERPCGTYAAYERHRY